PRLGSCGSEVPAVTSIVLIRTRPVPAALGPFSLLYLITVREYNNDDEDYWLRDFFFVALVDLRVPVHWS
ncbi:MAG: hypothetical protein PV344_07380, partial [Anaplasma sp.]|nr:hypothetical protein [Anaplasma sp.]